jgi:LCP family protein required for cell wall assembly
MASEARYTRNKRVNPDGSGSFTRDPREIPKPTRSQSAIEYILFAVFGILIVLAGIALWANYDPKHRIVANTFDAGLKQDRLNVVLIGIGGDAHPGGGKDLADSIILLSLKPSTKQAAVVSVPRDLWVHIGGYGTHRINYAHAIGNESGYPGEGPGLLCDTVSQVFGQPVNAFVRIDFSAFEKIVDDLGGVDVYCQRGFYDYLFRDGFAEGWHHLDGKRALAYARYRYVIGPEGDNFARELRQQQVINAVRDKMQQVSPQAAMHLFQIATTLSKNTKTNLTTPQLVTLYRTFHDIKPQQVRHVSLKPFTQLFEVTRLAEPGEAVRPRTGDFRELQAVESSIFSSGTEIVSPDQIQFAATPPARQSKVD